MIAPRTFAALALLTIMWGLNWPVMKLSLRELSPLYFRAVTMTGGVLLLVAWYRLRGSSLAVPLSQWPKVLAVALPNVLGWHALSIFGVQELASGRAAILGFTMPIWTVLLGVVFFGQTMTRRYWLAVACAALAVALLLRHEIVAMTGRPAGMAWMLCAAASWALGTLLLRRVPLAMSTEALTVGMFGVAVPVLWLLALLLEAPPAWSFSGTMWAALAYGAAVNYGVGQIIWFSIARRLPPVASTLSIMMIPVIGLASAMWLVGERPQPEDYAAAALIMAAIAVALLGGRSPSAA